MRNLDLLWYVTETDIEKLQNPLKYLTTNFVFPTFRPVLVAWLWHNHTAGVRGEGVWERRGASEKKGRKFFLISSIELKKKKKKKKGNTGYFIAYGILYGLPLWNSTYFFTVQTVSSEKKVEKHFIDHKASENLHSYPSFLRPAPPPPRNPTTAARLMVTT